MPIQPIPGFADPFSSFTHLAGAVIALAMSVPLVRRGRGSRLRAAALAVFGFACVFSLSMSGVYHLLPDATSGRYVLRVLDHAAIFVLIAGTFTPVHVIVFRGPWRWGVLGFVWLVAVTGITLASVFFDNIPEWLGLTMYLALGWFGLTTGVALWRRFGYRFVQPLVLGAIAYTLGALMDFAGWPVLVPGVVGPHGLFHVCVLCGLAFHWRFIAGIARTRPVYDAPARTGLNRRRTATLDAHANLPGRSTGPQP